MRRRIRSNKRLGFVVAALLALSVGACSDRVRGNVIKELPRPDGGVTALLVKQETWDHHYFHLYMRRDDDSTWRVFSSVRVYSPSDIEWVGPDALMIRMKCGQIDEYANSFGYQQNEKTHVVFIGLENTNWCKEP